MPITVLQVDDDEDIRAITKIALESIGGLNLVQCASGLEALKVISIVNPDIILLDSMMPVMSGEQTLIELRKIEKIEDTPIVFVTAKVHDEAMRNFHALGGSAVIVKPFDPLTLAEDLHTILQRCGSNK